MEKEQGGLRLRRGPYGVGLWKDILKESSWVCGNWEFRVGNGTRVKFRTNHGCGSPILSHSFLTLYEMADNKNETITKVWDQTVGKGSWNLNFLTTFNDWELQLVTSLLDAQQNVRVSSWLDRVF